MTAREDTIERIERVLKLTHKKSITVTIPRLTAERAVSMLKEQEPVKPIGFENWWKCPSCRGNIVANMKYCPGCGRSVEWDA